MGSTGERWRERGGGEEENGIRSSSSLGFLLVGLLQVGTAAANIATDATEMLIFSHLLLSLVLPLLEHTTRTDGKVAAPFLLFSNLVSVLCTGKT